MEKTDFYALPRPAQERFIDGTRRLSIPVSLAMKHAYRLEPYYWFGLSVALVIVWASFAALGYGDLQHDLALSGVFALVFQMVLAGAASYAFLRGIAVNWERRALPFRPGTYLFPGCLVVARSTKFTIYKASEFASVTRSERPLGLRIKLQSGKTYLFRVADEAQLQQIRTHLDQARQIMESPHAHSDARELSMLDPLIDSGISSPIGMNEPLKERRLMPSWLMIAIATLAGGALGWAAWAGRNTLSERELFRQALTQNSVAALQAYLDRGGEREQVRDILLPRAQLKEVMAQGEVGAIEAFRNKNPDSKIKLEIDAAYRQALLNALEKAKKSGTLTALLEFHRTQPGIKLIEREWRAAKQAVFDKALADFKEVAQPKNEDIVPFMQQLLAYAEKHGPEVRVRFAQSIPSSTERVDELLSKSPYYVNQSHRPSQYFVGDYAKAREKRLGEKLVARLQKAFPPDILKFELGPRIPDLEKDLPVPEVPTLFIEHRAQLSGGYIHNKPKGVFVGSALRFLGTFVLPSGEALLVTRYSAWRPPDLSVLKEPSTQPSDVYETMVSGGFDRFYSRLIDDIFADSE